MTNDFNLQRVILPGQMEELERYEYWIRAADGTPINVTREEMHQWRLEHGEERFLLKTWIGRTEISTVFLNYNEAMGKRLPPILWETLVIGGPLNNAGERYYSEQEAITGHRKYVELVMAAQPTNGAWTFGNTEYVEDCGDE